MRLKNATSYDGRALRSMIAATYRYVCLAEGSRHWWPHLLVEVVYSRSGAVSGYCSYNGGPMRLRLPRGGVGVDRVAWLAYHEFHHCFGYRHGSFTDANPADVAAIVGGLSYRDVLPVRPEKKMAPVDLRAKRHAQVVARIETWEAKLRRAERALRKLRAQRRYYERAQAATREVTS